MESDPPNREELLFGGPARYTHEQLAQLAGLSLQRAQDLWTALGFALPDPADIAFTDADLQAARTFAELRQAGVIAPNVELALTRALGQTMARLAEWQIGILHEFASSNADTDAEVDRVSEAAWLVEPIEQLQQYVWRRHLFAVNERAETLGADQEELLGVGFADVVGFTRLSRGLEQEELADFVEGFEAASADIVARHGGRVVKTIGDEVLFVATTATACADIGLSLADRLRDLDSRPDLRVGMAYGAVVRHLGDVYGSVVNLAARLTALARPGTALVDHTLAQSLAEHPGYRTRRLRRVSVRGFAHVQPWLLQRAPAD